MVDGRALDGLHSSNPSAPGRPFPRAADGPFDGPGGPGSIAGPREQGPAHLPGKNEIGEGEDPGEEAQKPGRLVKDRLECKSKQ